MRNKKSTYVISIVTAALLAGCNANSFLPTTAGSTTSSGASVTTGSGATSSKQCRDIQPTLQTLNKKYSPTKTAYADFEGSERGEGNEGSGRSEGSEGGEGSGGSHNEGINCLNCHNFSSGATVFNSLHATDNTLGASGYKIKLSDGTVYSNARGTGNSMSYSFPSGKFTAQVIDANGNVVNSSLNMSHDSSRRACNSCHSTSGNSGAPGRITSKRLTSSASSATTTNTSSCVSFSKNILPILTAKCKSCHGSNGKFTVTTANATYANIKALKGTASASGKYILDKSSNTVNHGGKQVISVSSSEYKTIKAWVDASALNN